MDLSSINPILLLASLMVSATPILLAAIGEVVVERSGVLNLGVEGLMITGRSGPLITKLCRVNPDFPVQSGGNGLGLNLGWAWIIRADWQAV